jgi:predicted nucleic acid-binding protein
LARYAALLDACVLVPIALADTLLRIAERELYRPLWSDRILEEAKSAILEVHQEIEPELIDRRFAGMNGAFEDALVTGWEPFEATVVLPDADDRHVVAAAMRGRADAIITANVRDYPTAVLEMIGIEALHPDDFLLDQLDLAPRIVLEVLREQAAHAHKPALAAVDLIVQLARAGVPRFADEAGRLI